MSLLDDPGHDVRPELRLLLLCARTRIDDDVERRIRDLLRAGIDWTDLVQSALDHHVAPLVARALDLRCADVVPTDLLAAFRLLARETRADNDRLTDELLALLGALGARGVSAVPFKGPLLAEQVYGDRGLRSFADLDFLIDERDVPVTLDVLRARDYAVDAPFTPTQLRAMRRAWGQDSFNRRDGRVTVEPHWALVPDKMALAIDHAALRARCESATLKGVSVPAFAPEDLALVLCVHGAKELWWRLGWVCDVAELLRAFPRLDWELALARGQRQGGRRMMLLGLALAQRLLGASLPDTVVRDIARDRTTVGLVDEAARRLLQERRVGAPTFNSLSRFRRRAHDGWRAQATYVLRTLCRPSAVHYEMIALPPALGFGYYLVKAAHDYVLLPPWRLVGRLRRVPEAARSRARVTPGC
jgi:Uncharacterised nucleotidyltransferase